MATGWYLKLNNHMINIKAIKQINLKWFKNLPLCEGSIVDIFAHHTTDLHPVTRAVFVLLSFFFLIASTEAGGNRGP